MRLYLSYNLFNARRCPFFIHHSISNNVGLLVESMFNELYNVTWRALIVHNSLKVRSVENGVELLFLRLPLMLASRLTATTLR